MALAHRSHRSEDAYKPAQRSEYGKSTQQVSFFRSLRAFRRRRIFLAFFGLIAVYFFIKNLPTDLTPIDERVDKYGRLRQQPPVLTPNKPVQGQPAGGNGEKEGYEGPIRFQHLADALSESAFRTRIKSDVLFAVSRLPSASHLAPLACDMAKMNRTHVHFAFLGRQSLNPPALLSTLGITAEDCPIFWVDGRPDYELVSSQRRIKASIKIAIGQMQRAFRLDAVFSMHDDTEDPLFVSAMKEATSSTELSLINIPKATSSMSWLTSLDTNTLQYLPKIEVDIVISAEEDSSGSLVRLLRSIQHADYTGLPVPRLIIEVSSHTDATTMDQVKNFDWPSTILIRRRIFGDTSSAPSDVVSIMESFYPRHPQSSHVLLLSTHAELAPAYYQYLTCVLLAYGYNRPQFETSQNIFGIALDFLERSSINPESIDSPFLLQQSPSTGAALYFGDKWTRLHAFVTQKTSRVSTRGPDVVSDNQLSWRQNVQDFMCAENLFLIYPSFNREFPVAVFHAQTDSEQADNGSQTLRSITMSSILSSISDAAKDGLTLSLQDLPLYSAEIRPLTWQESHQQAEYFANNFSLTTGGCSDLKDRDVSKQGNPEFLFCPPLS